MNWQKEFSQVSTTIDVKVNQSTKWGMDYGANEVSDAGKIDDYMAHKRQNQNGRIVYEYKPRPSTT